MNIALFLLLSVQLHYTLSNNFDVELESGKHIVVSQAACKHASCIASNQQCRKCKTMKCVKQKCEHPLNAVAQGCKICKNNKACQKKRCPIVDPNELLIATSGWTAASASKPDKTEGMCSWCRKNRKMWVCKCLKKRNRPKFCGHWYYKQLFSCKKKTGSNNDGNYAKQLDGYDEWYAICGIWDTKNNTNWKTGHNHQAFQNHLYMYELSHPENILNLSLWWNRKEKSFHALYRNLLQIWGSFMAKLIILRVDWMVWFMVLFIVSVYHTTFPGKP